MTKEKIEQEDIECGAADRSVVTVDQIAWIHKAIDSALRMASAMEGEVNTGAQLEIFRSGREGLCKGVVSEILSILYRGA